MLPQHAEVRMNAEEGPTHYRKRIKRIIQAVSWLVYHHQSRKKQGDGLVRVKKKREEKKSCSSVKGRYQIGARQ